MASPKQIARQQAQRFFSKPNDVTTFLRQMKQEAHFKDVNSPYAQGYAQFTPDTARSVGLKNPHDPTQAYGAAAKLMRSYLDKYHGSWEDALVAYNAGPGKVGLPHAQLPGETRGYLSTILGGSRPSAGAKPQNGAQSVSSDAGGTRQNVELGTKTTFDQAGFAQAQKRTLLAGLLTKHGRGSSVLFKSGLLSTAAPNPADFTTSALTSKIVTKRSGGGGGGIRTSPGSVPDTVRQIVEKANAIDAKHLPYKWGGGHGPTPAKPGVPVDCSGAVSELLGVNPRVSGQFASFGKAGRGKNVTIYANDHHVLMEINGHFWGTSGTNPGGGAGWIPRSAISPQYLKNFTARHPAGL